MANALSRKNGSTRTAHRGTCGHHLQAHDGPGGKGHAVIVRSGPKDDTRAVSFRNVCTACKHEYVMSGLILHTTHEQKSWLVPVLAVSR